MSLTNPKLFGLAVLSNFTDVRDPFAALQNLGINPLDLSVITGSHRAGMETLDWISFSRLKSPIYKALDRFNRESDSFSRILSKRAGIDQTLFGNLSINGSISGSAIRYRYLKGKGSSATVEFADISTSRASAWSSADSRANDSRLQIQSRAKISFGARVGIETGGKLVFEARHEAEDIDGDGIIDVPAVTGERLQTTIVPEPREFESEIPTSRIRCNIGGKEVFLYAMKGIPLIFKGNFAELYAFVIVSNDDPKVSWKIVDVGNPVLSSPYPDEGDTLSEIYYESQVARDRFIQIYKNPDHITAISIPRALIRDLPTVKLENCKTLNFEFNDIKTLPDFTFLTPNLKSIKLTGNELLLTDIPSEKKLNRNVLNKFPSGLTIFRLGSCFEGSIFPVYIIAERFPNLRLLDLNNEARTHKFGDDDDDVDGNCPLVSPTVTSYNISLNSFLKVPDSLEIANGDSLDAFNFYRLPELVTINCYSNPNLTSTERNLESANSQGGNPPTIETINFSSTDLPFPTNLMNTPSLKSYSAHDNDGITCQLVNSANGSYIFDNCNSLEDIILYRSDTGPVNFPFSFSNPALLTLNLERTNVKGGKPGDSIPKTLTVSSASVNTFNHTIVFSEPHGALTCDSVTYQSTTGDSIERKINEDTSEDMLVDTDGDGNGEETEYFAIKVNATTIRLALTKKNAHRGSNIQFADAGSGNHVFKTKGTSIEDEDQDHVIYEETFSQATAIKKISIISSSLLRKSINERAFRNNSELEEIRIYSYNRVIGEITNLFSDNDKLKYAYLNHNAFERVAPNFSGKINIRKIYLNNNKFSSSIPNFSNLTKLTHLYLHNNQFTAISEPQTLTALQYYYAHNNNIVGQIPDFSGCPNLRRLTLQNNDISGYESGSFVQLRKIAYIDLSFNKLKPASLNQILIDLEENNRLAPKSGINVNLKNQENNAIPTPFGPGMDAARALANAGWDIGINGGIQSNN